ncbi:MAG: ferredoxin [Candidatus Diapherotrites archaeon]|nr:ferredoxin [Candidatus Diapherotrites archaeon]
MVKVNATCIGCGACVVVCPASFEMGSDGKAHAKESSDCAEAAKNVCPVNAIEL